MEDLQKVSANGRICVECGKVIDETDSCWLLLSARPRHFLCGACATHKTTSPWGKVQDQSHIGNGIVEVSTPSHGGIFVPRELLKHIPQADKEYARKWSGSKQWYEEDVAILIPLYYLREFFEPGNRYEKVTDEKIKEHYDKVRRKYIPHTYMEIGNED